MKLKALQEKSRNHTAQPEKVNSEGQTNSEPSINPVSSYFKDVRWSETNFCQSNKKLNLTLF